MARVSLITYMFLLMVSCLHGAPFKHISHTGDANTDSKIISTVDCPENCSFVITENSLSDAQKDLAKFLNLKKSMLVYVNIDPHNLTLSPVNDQQKQNQMREWQWIMSTNSWYINLPIDLDYASFHVTYSGESRIRLKIEAIESNCCSISDAGIEQVRNILWSDLFTNRSGSLLCNRYFDHQEWKSTFYAFTTVWVGYDLLCFAPTIDKSYQEKSHAAASVLTPLFCFFIALYHPLINKIIENRYIKRQLKEVKESKDKMEIYDYIKGDKPFGYDRVILKCFFSKTFTKFHPVTQRIIPAIKLNIIYFIIYLIFNTVPMMLEHYHDKEELEDFYSIYKLGLPIFHYWKAQGFGYRYQILITSLVFLPFVSFANFWYFYQFSESTDFLIFLKFPTMANKSNFTNKSEEADKSKEASKSKQEDKSKEADKSKDADKSNDENTVCCCKSWTLSEDVDKIIENLKTNRNSKRIRKNLKWNIKTNTVHAKIQNGDICDKPNTSDESVNSFYSKFIKRFTLLFSLVFWKYILDLSTKTSYDSQSKSNEDKKKLGCCIKRCLIGIIVIPINFFLIVLTCAFPVFWFVMFPFLNRIKKCLSVLGKFFYKECQKCEQMKSNDKQNSPTTNNEQINESEDRESIMEKNVDTKVIEGKPNKSEERESIKGKNNQTKMRKGKPSKSEDRESIKGKNNQTKMREGKPNQSEDEKSITDYCNFESIIIWLLFCTANQIIYFFLCIACPITCLFFHIARPITSLFFHIACIFLLYHQFSVIVLMLRSVVYILFIAITNYEHLLRIFIVVTSCFAYLGVFIATYIGRYAAILKIIFDEFEKNIHEAPKDTECAKEEKETIFIPEECFDYVIDHCYAVREHFFVVIFKIVITIMFFILSLAVLLQSNIFDSTAKLTNIIDFVFIIVTPSVLFKFFDKDEQEIIHDHERDIRQRTKEYYEQPQHEDSEEDTGEPSSSKDSYTSWCEKLCCCSSKSKDEKKPLLFVES